MTQKKKIVSIVVGIVVLVALCVGGWFLYQNFMPKGEAGAKTVTISVVHGDGSQKDFSYETEEAYLGPVLTDNQLVEGDVGEYGLFITAADGETADDSKQQWWCITKGGEQVNTSADQTPIADGDTFELTLTEGY